MRALERLARQRSRTILGLMTGTSGDGIDTVLTEIEGCGESTQFRLLEFRTCEIADELREDLFRLFQPDALVDDLCRLNFALGEALADAALSVIEGAGMKPAQVDLVGSHGQTVRHLPGGHPPSTLQIGEPAVIAQRTGITTIADFRPADIAAGGEGAPLVPLVDHMLFTSKQGKGRIMLNIGGIANVTVLPAGGGPDDVLAFDTGPGNVLLDGAVVYLSGGRERFDRDGARAAAGRADAGCVARLMEHEFIGRTPPKSTGREEFGTAYLAQLFAQLFDPLEVTGDDLLATLTAFTATAIAAGIDLHAPDAARVSEVWVSGGGVHNGHLMKLLTQMMPTMTVAPIDALGVSADAKEALSFAVLANEALMGRTGNLPSATGALRPAVLGKIAIGSRTPHWVSESGSGSGSGSE